MSPALRFVCHQCGQTGQTGGACPRDGGEYVDASADPLLGTEVAGYRITRAIGRGGMGAVYRAVQPAIDAEVAIKLLGADLVGDPEAMERFVAEAKVANLVRHEGLVKVLALGMLPDGRPYQIMEHLTGVPLKEVIYGPRQAPLGTLLQRLAEALRAIHVMHERGIVHRDLKPTNLFATTAGYVKVLDFGIAKLAAGAAGLTRTGHTIGTPGYMSPEQASALDVDVRTDVYAMGVVLFEAVALRRPFEGRLVEALATGEAPPALAGTLPYVTPALDRVIATAMAFEPDDRYPTADAMAQALDAVTATLPPSLFGPLLSDEQVQRASAPRIGSAPSPVPAATPESPATVPGGSPLPVATTVPEADMATRRESPSAREDAIAPANGDTTLRQLGRFVVEGTVGSGGEGRVLVGIDPAIQRKVALKLLHRAGPERHARLVAEARAMARISHPNVVTLYELGEDDDQLFLAMEYLEAIDLARWLAQQRRGWRAIVTMFVEAGRGLAAAHAAGVIHRDFKPSNVLLGKDGRPRVGDFGIARAGGEAEGGQGTVAYMPPEQLEGGTVDPRSDQFAFCASLWEALHGVPPYARPGMSAVSVALAAHKGELQRGDVAGVPASIDAILRRGLATDPADRFPSMDALLEALAPTPRRRVLPWLLVGTGVVVAAVAVTWTLGHSGSSKNAPTTPAQPRLSLGQIRELPVPDRLAAIAALPEAERTSEAVRSLIGDTVATQGIVRKFPLPSAPARTPALAVAASGRRFAVALRTGIWVHSFDERGKPSGDITLPAPPEEALELYIDEPGGTLRARSSQGILEIPLGGGVWTSRFKCQPRNAKALQVDHALRRAACNSYSGFVLTDISQSRQWSVGSPYDFAFSPDGQHFLGVDGEPAGTAITDLVSGENHGLSIGHGAPFSVGDHFLAIAEGTRVRVLSYATNTESVWKSTEDTPIVDLAILNEAPLRVAAVFASRQMRVLGVKEGVGLVDIDWIWDLPPQFSITASGGRTLSRLADRIVVDDEAHATSWELMGMPATFAADPATSRIVVLDSDAVRVWDIGARLPQVVSFDKYVLVMTDRRGLLVSDEGQLRLFDVTDPTRAPLSTSLSADAKVVPANGAEVPIRIGDVLWAWRPGQEPISLGAQPDASSVHERDGVRYVLEKGAMYRLPGRERVCGANEDFVIDVAPSVSVVVVRSGKRAELCDLATGARTVLDAPTNTGTKWRFSNDSTRLFALDLDSLTVFDVPTGAAVVTIPAGSLQLDSVIDGDDHRVVVLANEGVFAAEQGTFRQLAQRRSNLRISYDASARSLVEISDNDVLYTMLDAPVTRRTVGRSRFLATQMTSGYGVQDAVLVVQRHVDAKQGEVAIWPLTAPPTNDTERWLELARQP